MDVKSVLQEQVRELQKLQDENAKTTQNISIKASNAVLIADEILKICQEVRTIPTKFA